MRQPQVAYGSQKSRQRRDLTSRLDMLTCFTDRSLPPRRGRTTRFRECRARSAVLPLVGRTRPNRRASARPCTSAEPNSGRCESPGRAPCRPSSGTQIAGAGAALDQGFRLPFGPLARLAQNETVSPVSRLTYGRTSEMPKSRFRGPGSTRDKFILPRRRCAAFVGRGLKVVSPVSCALFLMEAEF